MPFPDKPYFAFGDDGALYRFLAPTRVLNAESALASLASNAPLQLRSIFIIDGQPVHLALKKTHAILAMRITNLTLNTFFRLSGGVLVPEFKPRFGLDEYLDIHGLWQPPVTMKLWFAVNVQLAASPMLPFRNDNPFLVAQHTGSDASVAGFWKLPLPNQYGDGRLCLGDTFHEIAYANLQDHMLACKKLLDTSAWNTDQLPLMSAAQEMFKLDPLTNQRPVPVPGPTWNWTAFCTRVSNPVMMEAFLP